MRSRTEEGIASKECMCCNIAIPSVDLLWIGTPTWYGDLLRYRHGGAVLVSDSDSDRVGPWTKGYLRTTTDGSGQVSNREGLLSCLTSAER